ncbi:glycosyltransferase family 4 protein [Aquicella lusitana]|jgi:Glycosyltransferase|uniref:Glycosyltransferase involved in cell wall biosynthesis n=1 Tax=Aquicella lusitana TaxID=254246 RepID=A0A370GWQ2_9COXI|nr:glycosyltransferase family 4 protein [Aquicella lusitana]RDI48115.1 glycosyltransferase involved in cell wall biosynthesis [Aquicella lusitana]VVC72869.1 D-inositol 3-phosphate glycosyltransferase [Aquicella lusitana]
MRIAYATTFDARDVHNWSGTPSFMSKALSNADIEVDFIGSLSRKLPPLFKLKQAWNKFVCDQRESPRFNTVAAKHYSEQVARQLEKLSVDAVVSPLINPIAYLDCKQPIILWTDAVYAALLGFYPPFSYHSANTIMQGNAITQACLSRARLALFSSDWAARSAVELYGISREKVKVVPFGANIDTCPDLDEIRESIKKRAADKIKLLFLAKSWERKGGDVVLAVAKALHEAGHAVELTIVGYQPPNLNPVPSYVKCLGFISKHTPEGKQKIQTLLSETHFLFVPSRAEAYGIVFCEANAFGVPCLTTYVGGIGTIVKDNINGMTFGLDAPVSTYCDYIVDLMRDRMRYEALSLSAYNEYVTRLNWKTAANEVKKLIQEAM